VLESGARKSGEKLSLAEQSEVEDDSFIREAIIVHPQTFVR